MRAVLVWTLVGYLLMPLSASAISVRAPAMPAKFLARSANPVGPVWQQPLVNTFSAARTQGLAISPQLRAFIPVVAVGRDGGQATFAPNVQALGLLTAHLEQSGMTEDAYNNLSSVEERVAALQTAYVALSREVETHARQLIEAAREAETQAARNGLSNDELNELREVFKDVHAQLSLLLASYSGFLSADAAIDMGLSRNSAFAAYARMTQGAVNRASAEGERTMSAAGRARATEAADAVSASPSRQNDPNAAARDMVLAPVRAGRIPDGFLEDFARFQQMGDPRLALEALAVFKPILKNPFATDNERTRALNGVILVAREGPTQMARDRAILVLTSERFTSPEVESMRVDVLLDIARDADKETLAAILRSFSEDVKSSSDNDVADLPGKLDSAIGKIAALQKIESIWKERFPSVPTPKAAEGMRKKAGANIFGGLLGAAGAVYGYFHVPTALPAFLSFAAPALPFLPYLVIAGGVIAVLRLIWGIYRMMRAGPAIDASRGSIFDESKD